MSFATAVALLTSPSLGLVRPCARRTLRFLTLLRALKVNFDLRHVNHIRYYYYYYNYYTLTEQRQW